MNRVVTAVSGVRVPQIPDLELAIRMYYEKIELKTGDIRQLFGGIGGERALKLKRLGRERMREKEILAWDASAVNTKAAYEAWGLEISDLEKRYSKLISLETKKRQLGE